jgi:hypothetical protein
VGEVETFHLTWSSVDPERDIIAVVGTSAVAGEQRELAFGRKQQQLAALFVRLVLSESHALQRRLALWIPGAPITLCFSGLVPARRHRQLTFRADTRRRHPLHVERTGGCRG